MQKTITTFVAVLLAVQFFVPNFADAGEYETCEVPTDPVAPVVSATGSSAGVLVEWDAIDHDRFQGYKVVISHSDSSPMYSEDGYIAYITNPNTTSFLVNNDSAYKNGDFGSYLDIGDTYYFSVTALYNCGYKEAGNAVQVTYEGPAHAGSSDLPVPVVSASATDDGVVVSWDAISHSNFQGYKVVISQNNSSPKYSEDGYLTYITNKNTTSKLVNNSQKYNNGDFGEYLETGNAYYFSVTAVYTGGYKIPGNAVKVTYPGEVDDTPVLECKNYKLVSESPTRDKYWEKLGLDTSKHPDIMKYRVKWSTGKWSEWFTAGEGDYDWKDNCGDQYYLGGRNYSPDRPAECSRRVWSYFTDHYHEYYLCKDNGVFTEPKSSNEKEQWNKYVDEAKEYKKQFKSDKEFLEDINKKAKLLNNNQLDDILVELKELRDLVREQQVELKYLRNLAHEMQGLASNMRSAIQNFVTYGVDDNTKHLGEGERAAVINSYKEAFGKLPDSETELEDAIKIANGRWPSKRNRAAEQRAIGRFQEIYDRLPNFDNPSDDAAVTIMAYGLRQRAENRNLQSEQRGIGFYHDIFGSLPETTEDWNVMQAITYSGATK